MKISLEEIVTKKEWLHSELLHSLPAKLIDQCLEEGYYDVKLLVNGVELEPKLLNLLLTKIEEHIDKQAQSIVAEELFHAKNKINRLGALIEEAAYKIRDEFDISEQDY